MEPMGAAGDRGGLQLYGVPGNDQGAFNLTTLKVIKLVAFLMFFAVAETASYCEASRLTDYRLRAIGYSVVSLLLIMPVVAIYNTIMQVNEESQGGALFGLRAVVLRWNLPQLNPVLIGAHRPLQGAETRSPEVDGHNSDIEDEGPAIDV